MVSAAVILAVSGCGAPEPSRSSGPINSPGASITTSSTHLVLRPSRADLTTSVYVGYTLYDATITFVVEGSRPVEVIGATASNDSGDSMVMKHKGVTRLPDDLDVLGLLSTFPPSISPGLVQQDLPATVPAQDSAVYALVVQLTAEHLGTWKPSHMTVSYRVDGQTFEAEVESKISVCVGEKLPCK